MNPYIALPTTPSIRAELEYIYDAPVIPGGLRVTLGHPPLTVWLVREGQVDLTFSGPGPSLRGTPGDALILPGSARSHRMTSGTRLLSCRIHLTSPTGEIPWRHTHPFRMRDGMDGLITAAERLEPLSLQLFGSDPTHSRFPRDRETCADAERMLEWSSVFADWVREFLRIVRHAGWELQMTPAARPTVTGTLAVMEEEGWGKGFKGEDLAEAFGVSLSQFKRRFRHETGLPFKQWLDRERLRRITGDLESGMEPLKSIAYDYGFSSPSHFSAWFRRQTGTSPLAYRKTLGGVGI